MPHDGQTGITFESGGQRLLGTLFLARGDDPKPTALLLHGMPGIEKNVDMALILRERGWNSVLFHYKGCWGSGGLYDLASQPADVIAALDYLAAGDHPQVDMARLIAIGHSMGGWAALLAAARDARIQALATIGAVTDPRQIQWSDAAITGEFIPWLPGLSADAFRAQWAALNTPELIPVMQAPHIAPRPLLIIHAAQDAAVPAAQAEALHGAAPFAELAIHPEANHSFTWDRDWLIEWVWGWLLGLGV